MTTQPPTLPHRQLHWGLVACAVVSVAIHLLLLIGLPKSRLAADFRPADYRTLEARKVQVRLVEGKAAPRPAPPAQNKKKPPAPVANAPPKAAAPATSAPVVATAATAAQPEPPAPGPLPEPSEFDGYLPRALLTEPPEALTEIVIEAPQEEEFPGRRVGVLTLFIDEDGQVRHVAPDDILLPPTLEQLAREAFVAGRFSPGRVDGQATKSRMRVEVVFE
ncbi:hypothetical protein ACIPRI_07285 [Variovorax sp. LARHSF232]